MPFRGFSAEVNIQDRRRIRRNQNRLIPFSRSPFRETSLKASHCPQSHVESIPLTGRAIGVERGMPVTESGHLCSTSSLPWDSGEDKANDELVGGRPPAWMELSGDLAWTATFSSLTSNTEITTIHGVVSYGVFFTISWQLWAGQAAYDIRYYTNDWCHRIFFILQLIIYGALAALTSNFDVFWGFTPEASIFVPLDTPWKTADAMRANDERTKRASFQGIALILAISRCLLLIQYLRVIYYRRRHHMMSLMHIITPISVGFSALLFFICYALLHVSPSSVSTSVSQYVLWTCALAAEVLGHVFTPDDPIENLRGHSSVVARLSILTVIIMGEGLNGLSETLRHSVNSFGFGRNALGLIVAMALILYFIWFLYFDGLCQHLSTGKRAGDVWLILHLPFHLTLILLLEGIKNAFLYSNLWISAMHYRKIVEGLSPFWLTGSLPESDEMERALQRLGLSWEQQRSDFAEASLVGVQDGLVQWWRWDLKVIYSIWATLTDGTNSRVQWAFERYQEDRTLVEEDLKVALDSAWNGLSIPRYGPKWEQIVNMAEEPLFRGQTWLSVTSGLVILALATLNLARDRPQDRYTWGTLFTRYLAGILLVCTVLVSTVAWRTISMKSALWVLPAVAVMYAAITFVEWTLLWLSVRSARKQDAVGGFVIHKSQANDTNSTLYTSLVDDHGFTYPQMVYAHLNPTEFVPPGRNVPADSSGFETVDLSAASCSSQSHSTISNFILPAPGSVRPPIVPPNRPRVPSPLRAVYTATPPPSPIRPAPTHTNFNSYSQLSTRTIHNTRTSPFKLPKQSTL